MTIWIIDDLPEDLYIAERILRKAGYNGRICLFQCPEEALSQLRNPETEQNHFPDFILLDIQMPIMSGFEMLDQLSHIPFQHVTCPGVIMLTSSADPGDIARAYSYRMVKGYLIKPLNTEKVGWTLKQLQHL